VGRRAKSLKTWWPGTELNRRSQPFQGCSHPMLSVDSAKLSITSLRDFVLFIGAKMEPSCKNLSLPRFASISTSLVSSLELLQFCKQECQLIKGCRTSAGQLTTITLRNQPLAHNLARTEALCPSSEKARIGAHRLGAYGTFCGTPRWSEPLLLSQTRFAH